MRSHARCALSLVAVAALSLDRCGTTTAFSFAGRPVGLARTWASERGLAGARLPAAPTAPVATGPSMGTSAVIENVVSRVLKVALANGRHASVQCSVSSSAMGLMRGSLNEAKVNGLDWRTPMGLTVRTIDLTIAGMQIKLDDVFRGKISFKMPAKGRAILDMNTQDFGNFLVHPLLAVADLPSGAFVFSQHGTGINPYKGRAKFEGQWRGERVVLEACQPERFGTIYVRVAEKGRLTPLGVETLGREMSHFFNTVTLELDGTDVHLSDMRLGVAPDGEPTLRVTVDVVVNRIPRPESMRF